MFTSGTWRLIGVILLTIAAMGHAQEGVVRLSYSSADTDKSPRGNASFQGPFWNETLTVSAENLPRHDFVEITFDLLIIRSWDGNAGLNPNGRPTAVGPDFFRLGIANGPTLLYTTFSNIPDDPGFRAESKFQNYPLQVPGDRRLPQTGVTVANSMGYHYPWPGPPQMFPMDAIYPIRFVIPHQDSKIAIEMTGMNLQNIIDESWGIRNMQVKAIPPDQFKPPDQAAIATAFGEALDPTTFDPTKAFQTLLNGRDDTAWWLKTSIVPVQIDGEQVAGLIKDMWGDDTKIADRDAALGKLIQMGPPVEPFLRDARKSAAGEQRLRIDWVLGAIAVTPIPNEDLRKVMLATRILEIINTPEALKARMQLVQK